MPAVFTKPKSAVRAIATARAVSITGGAAAFAALNLAIYQKTQSEAWLAATMFLTFGVAGIAGLFAGILGDRFDRRKVMIVSDVVSGVFFTALIFTDDPVWMVIFAFLSAVAEAPLSGGFGGRDPRSRAGQGRCLGQLAVSVGPQPRDPRRSRHRGGVLRRRGRDPHLHHQRRLVHRVGRPDVDGSRDLRRGSRRRRRARRHHRQGCASWSATRCCGG